MMHGPMKAKFKKNPHLWDYILHYSYDDFFRSCLKVFRNCSKTCCEFDGTFCVSNFTHPDIYDTSNTVVRNQFMHLPNRSQPLC